jgi:hypothetical protein
LRPNESGLSVFDIDGLHESEIRDLSSHFNRVFGHASIAHKQVRSVGLRFMRDDNPRPRHGNIVDWPKTKEEQMSVAQQLAVVATPTLY